jgi:hypothetical protein
MVATKICGDEQLAWTGSFNGRDYLAYALSLPDLDRKLIVFHVFKNGRFSSTKLVRVDRFPRKHTVGFVAERIGAFCIEQGISRLKDNEIDVSEFDVAAEEIPFSLKSDADGNFFLLPRDLAFAVGENVGAEKVSATNGVVHGGSVRETKVSGVIDDANYMPKKDS